MKILIILFVLALFYLFLICPRRRRIAPFPSSYRFFAHRGLHDAAAGIPENSLAAFRRAMEWGYGIELDVRLSADRVPVVFHDASLSRMCAIDVRVDSLTLQELQQYSLAGGERIPSLKETLSAIGGKVPLLIEIKMERLDFSLVRAVDALLSSYSGEYLVQSFHPAALWWYRLHRPQVLRGQLSTHFNAENRSLSPFQFLLGKMVLNAVSRPDFLSYNWHFRQDVSLFLCRRLFSAPCAGWVIRSSREMEVCRRDFDLFIFEKFLPERSWRETSLP